jgi:hypothetical protein
MGPRRAVGCLFDRWPQVPHQSWFRIPEDWINDDISGTTVGDPGGLTTIG